MFFTHSWSKRQFSCMCLHILAKHCNFLMFVHILVRKRTVCFGCFWAETVMGKSYLHVYGCYNGMILDFCMLENPSAVDLCVSPWFFLKFRCPRSCFPVRWCRLLARKALRRLNGSRSLTCLTRRSRHLSLFIIILYIFTYCSLICFYVFHYIWRHSAKE